MFCFFRVMSGDWAHAAFARRVGVREKRMTTVERGAVRKEKEVGIIYFRKRKLA